jgi:hypothetical protein
MGLFTRKSQPQEYDPARHELIEVKGQDANGETVHEYIRDQASQRIIGTPQWSYRVLPTTGQKGGKP